MKAARRSCKHAYRLWVNAGRPCDPNNRARLSYKQAKRVFRAHIWLHRKLADEAFDNSLDLDMDPHSFFQPPDQLAGNRPATSFIKVDGTSFEGLGIVEGWAKYFETLATHSRNQLEAMKNMFIAY